MTLPHTCQTSDLSYMAVPPSLAAPPTTSGSPVGALPAAGVLTDGGDDGDNTEMEVAVSPPPPQPVPQPAAPPQPTLAILMLQHGEFDQTLAEMWSRYLNVSTGSNAHGSLSGSCTDLARLPLSGRILVE